MLTRTIAAMGALNASMLHAAQATIGLGTALERHKTPPAPTPVPLRAPKMAGASMCGCGRVISGNKMLCKRCIDAILAQVNGLMRAYDQRVEELAGMQWADDGGPGG